MDALINDGFNYFKKIPKCVQSPVDPSEMQRRTIVDDPILLVATSYCNTFVDQQRELWSDQDKCPSNFLSKTSRSLDGDIADSVIVEEKTTNTIYDSLAQVLGGQCRDSFWEQKETESIDSFLGGEEDRE